MPDVMDLIPHRFPFLLIDRVIERPSALCVVVEKRVTANDPALASGTLPDMMLIDAMAQAAATLHATPGHRGYLVQLAACEFFARAIAGDTLRLRATQLARLGAMCKVAVEARVDALLVAQAELTFMIEVAA